MAAPRFAMIDLNKLCLGYLSADEVGVYALLLQVCWANDGTLPADQKFLKNFAKISPHRFQKVWPAISHLFYEGTDQNFHSELIDFCRQRTEHLSEVRRDAGSKGLAKRWQLPLQNDGNSDASRMANASAIAKVLPSPKSNPKRDLPLTSETLKPRPRARKRRVEGQKVEGVFGADPKAPNGHATTERSSTPGFRQVQTTSHVSPAKAALMSKCARYVGPDKASEFWAAMLGPNASTVLSQTAEAMRQSNWQDPG